MRNRLEHIVQGFVYLANEQMQFDTMDRDFKCALDDKLTELPLNGVITHGDDYVGDVEIAFHLVAVIRESDCYRVTYKFELECFIPHD